VAEGSGASPGLPCGSIAADPRSHASLLDDGELQNMTMRWKDIQAEFVDEPAVAVREADALVAELVQRLATMFATKSAPHHHLLSSCLAITMRWIWLVPS
jgi:hypothetical protein